MNIKVGTLYTFKSEARQYTANPILTGVEEIITCPTGYMNLSPRGMPNLVSDTITAKADRLYGKMCPR